LNKKLKNQKDQCNILEKNLKNKEQECKILAEDKLKKKEYGKLKEQLSNMSLEATRFIVQKIEYEAKIKELNYKIKNLENI
jgi:hypothetical protein